MQDDARMPSIHDVANHYTTGLLLDLAMPFSRQPGAINSDGLLQPS